MHRRPRLSTLVATAVAAAGLAVSAAPASAAPFVATLEAPNHTPKAGGTDWRITVTVRSPSGRPLRATATYQFLYNGQVVATRYPNPGHRRSGKRPYAFRGRYRDTILWPKRAAGYTLTFRVVVAVRGQGRENLDWRVRVRR
ncbi:MAG: hypothetical protein IRZ32_11720 [Solirubrobacteraceae bacterium]|nr:hypothetical protein [Solirubrobacteraceae bacterium]